MNRRRFLKWLGLGSLGGLIGSGFWFTRALADNPYYSGPKSDHFDGRTFFNPQGVAPGSFKDLLKWQLLEKRATWPDTFISSFHGMVPKKEVDDLQVTMIGHASLLIQISGINIVTDPVYSLRASPFQIAGPKRINQPGIAFEDLPPIDIILVTHNHYDHLDLLTLDRLVKRNNPLIITPLGNDAIIKAEVGAARITTGDWGDVIDLPDDINIHFEPCHHWSARGTRDRRMALWSAFVIESANRRVYHVGDTGFHEGINYKTAAEKHGGFDLAILPIGAYEPRWFMKGQHQNPAEAVEGFKLCGANYAIGHHWGTFQLTNEAIEEPIEFLATELKKQNVEEDRFVPMRPGQTWIGLEKPG